MYKSTKLIEDITSNLDNNLVTTGVFIDLKQTWGQSHFVNSSSLGQFQIKFSNSIFYLL